MEEVTKTDIEEAFKSQDQTLAEALDEQESKVEPAESSTEKGEGTEPSASDKADEENTPYHKRWKQREAKLREEYETEMERLKSELTSKSESSAFAKDLYGDNEDGKKNLDEWKRQIVSEAKAEALMAVKQEKLQYDNAVKRSEAWIDSQLEALTAEGKSYDKNKLLKIVSENQLLDAEGNWNIRAAHKIYEAETRPDTAKSEARKQLADTTTARSKGDTSKKSKLSWEQMRKAGTHPDFEAMGF